MSTLEASALILRPNLPQAYRVLIVDDDELVREQLTALFEAAGYEVSAAATGEEALERIDAQFCPIVITDLNMPDMNGIELCECLRARTSGSYVYILMLTARSGNSDILAGLSAGADDYICKAASREELLARLEVARRIINLEQSLRHANTQNRMLAVTDALTGAYNRRYLSEYLPKEFSRSRRYRHPLATLACDIDHFKRINDTYGHGVGDEVLQAFVSRAVSVLRVNADWIARSGGEEFTIVLPETDLATASKVGDRIRHVISNTSFDTAAGPVGITVSVGVSSIEPTNDVTASANDLLQTADQCLYMSKHAGRDRTTALPVGRGSDIPMAIAKKIDSERQPCAH